MRVGLGPPLPSYCLATTLALEALPFVRGLGGHREIVIIFLSLFFSELPAAGRRGKLLSWRRLLAGGR